MSETDNFSISLSAVEREDLKMQLHITDEFFIQIVEQYDIEGGDLQIQVRASHGAGDCFTFHYKGEGKIIVPCDRCLESTSITIFFDEKVKVAYEDEDKAGDDSLTLIPLSQPNYDIAWDIYEAIALNCPIQRVHPDGSCNADMLGRFSTEAEDEAEDEYEA